MVSVITYIVHVYGKCIKVNAILGHIYFNQVD